MKNLTIGLTFLFAFSPVLASAQTAEPTTLDTILAQLIALQAQLTEMLSQQSTEQLALITAISNACPASVLPDAVNSTVFGAVSSTSPSTINSLSRNPDGSDAAVAALRLEVENDRALRRMCADTTTRTENKTANRLCVESGF